MPWLAWVLQATRGWVLTVRVTPAATYRLAPQPITSGLVTQHERATRYGPPVEGR